MEPGVQATVPAPPVKVERRVRVKAIESTEVQLAKLDKLRQSGFPAAPFEFNPKQFEFKVSTDDDSEAPVSVHLPLTMFKAKNRKQNVIKLNTRDREMILRTLNRSINLRTAS
jgi:hypothetical protein